MMQKKRKINQNFIKNLPVFNKILLPFGLVFLIVAVNQMYITRFQQRSQRESNIVNLVGTTRSYALQIFAEAQAVESGNTGAILRLRNSVEALDNILQAVKSGGTYFQTDFPEPTKDIKPFIDKSLQTWQPYKQAALQILQTDSSSQTLTANRYLKANYMRMFEQNDALVKAFIKDSDVKTQKENTFLYVLIGSGTILALLVFFMLGNAIVNPIKQMAQVSSAILNGKTEERITHKSQDEIGKISEVINRLADDLQKATEFTREIGKGNYQTELSELNIDKGNAIALFSALEEMRNKLLQVSIDDQKRSWINEGLAKFSELLRYSGENTADFAQKVLSFLVKYLKANQGSLFIINDTNVSETYLELSATFAYGKKKFAEKKIGKGEGLVGQAWIEAQTIYITNAPENYVQITSGLGDANPRNIIIVPLKIDLQVLGVLELASFDIFELHSRNFLEQVAESIAISIKNVKVNARTEYLLEESQQLTEEMKAQEEEMRQSMEELRATQEEMQIAQEKLNAQSFAMNSSLLMVEYEPNGTIIIANQNLLDVMQYNAKEIKGKQHRIFVDNETVDNGLYLNFWKNLTDGIIQKGDFKRVNKHGQICWLKATYTPITNYMNQVTKVIEIAFDITHEKNELLQKDNEVLQVIAEMKANDDDLKNMEARLRKTMFSLQTTQKELEEKNKILLQIQTSND
jgi:PAS domain S-box-containing protein